MNRSQSDHISYRQYLVQEALLILVVSYFLFFGGTLNGLVVFQAITVTLGLVASVSLAWLGWRAFRRRWVETPPLWLPVLAVALAYILTGSTSMDPRRSLNAIWVLVLEIWVFLLVYDLTRHGWPADLFIKVLLLLGAIVVAFVLWQLLDWERRWLAIAGWSAPLPPIWLRPAPFYAHANSVAAFTNLLWPLALAWMWNTRSRLTRLWCSLLIAGCWLVLVFSSSRGALLAAAGALALMLLLLVLGGQRQILTRIKMWLTRSRRQAWLAAVALAALGSGMLILLARILAHPTHGPFWDSRSQFWQVALDVFRHSPLVGSGPDTFASDYMRWQSVPPQPLYLRAHSMLMQLAAETGATGLAASAWLLLALLLAAYRRWQAAQSGARYLTVGLCGALVTAGLHSLVDTPTLVPAIAMALAMLVAVLLSLELPGQPARPAWQRPAGAIVATSAAVLIVGSGAWMQFAYEPYYHAAALGNVSDWTGALPWLQEAARRDPGHAYYHLQAGFAEGMSALDQDPTKLSQAIAYYQAGISHEPNYSLNHANLAVLLWQQGDQSAAIAAMQRAAELAPGEATYPLNLGIYYQVQGDAARAAGFYRRALTLRPDWASAYFWRSSATRRALLQDWQSQQTAQTSEPMCGIGKPGLKAEETLARCDRVIRKNPSDATAYLGRAAALIALGRWDEAEYALRLADFLAQGGGAAISAQTQNDIAYYQALVTYHRGQPAQAIQALERVLGQVRDQTLFGPGGEGAALYGWGVFYRVGWNQDALPGLEIIRFTDEQINRLVLLGRWYEASGDTASARRVYREALQAAPDTAQAAERLAALEGQ